MKGEQQEFIKCRSGESDVSIEVAVAPLTTPLSYLLPPGTKRPPLGAKVRVPLGSRTVDGYVLETPPVTAPPAKAYKKKPIVEVVVPYPCFTTELLNLFSWVADYYCEPLASVIEVAIPASVPPRFDSQYTWIENADPEQQRLGVKQKQILAAIKERVAGYSHQELLHLFPGATATIKSLVSRSLVAELETEVRDQPSGSAQAPAWAKQKVELTEAQRNAVNTTTSALGSFQSVLLHGVTGSGKTEVYIDSIKAARARGYGALILVPEIALTPQLIDRFRSRLGSDLAILHSGLSPRTRWDAWRSLLDGTVSVALGVRSAVFAPVKNLGIIVVDEEHDTSYKQSDGLRYHARDLAVYRAHLNQCPIILGSATPSLESFHNAIQKRYTYISLAERHATHRNLTIDVVDLNKIRIAKMPSPSISEELLTALKTTVSNNEQAFVLYNRRGFASYLQCTDCEAVLTCTDCNVTYTYHQSKHLLCCHYCGRQISPPAICPTCPGAPKETRGDTAPQSNLALRGAGTERVIDELSTLLPDVPMARLDRDSVDNLDHYRAILDSVRNLETKILVGTQMIAKGHDLPHVTLVGVVDCDVGLHLPDFRAPERIFQLLTQAAGRAGRGEKPGRVILQTRLASHPSIQCTITQDYEAFAANELNLRKDAAYPPFSRLVRCIVSDKDNERAAEIIKVLRDQAREIISRRNLKIALLGPAPASLSKLRALWRWHMMMKSQSSKDLRTLVLDLQAVKIRGVGAARIVYDVDPHDMM